MKVDFLAVGEALGGEAFLDAVAGRVERRVLDDRRDRDRDVGGERGRRDNRGGQRETKLAHDVSAP